MARVAFGANDNHVVKAFRDAESYEGTSLILAYSHCIAHGFDLKTGMSQQKKGRGIRALAAPSVRSAPRRGGKESPPAGQQGAHAASQGLCLRRDPLRHAPSGAPRRNRRHSSRPPEERPLPCGSSTSTWLPCPKRRRRGAIPPLRDTVALHGHSMGMRRETFP